MFISTVLYHRSMQGGRSDGRQSRAVSVNLVASQDDGLEFGGTSVRKER